MEIYLPNSAHPSNFGGFLRKCDFRDPEVLEIKTHPKWISVHPVTLALVAGAAARVRREAGEISADIPEVGSLPYFVRMRLFEELGLDPPVQPEEHEPAGRFIPISQVRTNAQLDEFIVEMVPLLHAEPEEVGPIKYVLSELIRNVIEHANSPVGAFVAAQLFHETQRLAIGVADAGVGIRSSINRAHYVDTARGAIDKALRPGVTGTTREVGGTADNAGAGLFFTKAIARASRNYFVIYSGDTLYKLTPGSRSKSPEIEADPNEDPHRWEEGLPPWPGTLVGMDISVEAHRTLPELFEQIRDAYGLETRHARREDLKRPRFE